MKFSGFIVIPFLEIIAALFAFGGGSIFVRLFLAQSAAGSTLSAFVRTPVRTKANQRIFGRKFMPMLAMSFTGITGLNAFAAPPVFNRWHGIDMGGIDALSYPTKMVTVQTCVVNSDEALVNVDVSRPHLAVNLNGGITAGGKASCPFPTRRAVVEVNGTYTNFREDASEKFSINGKSFRICINHGLSLLIRFRLWLGLSEPLARFARAVFILPVSQS